MSKFSLHQKVVIPAGIIEKRQRIGYIAGDMKGGYCRGTGKLAKGTVYFVRTVKNPLKNRVVYYIYGETFLKAA